MTKKHLTTHLEKANLYSKLQSKHPIGFVAKGEWMWAIKETQDHYYVLSSKTEGWVSKTDSSELSGYDLHVKVIDATPYYYLQVA